MGYALSQPSEMQAHNRDSHHQPHERMGLAHINTPRGEDREKKALIRRHFFSLLLAAFRRRQFHGVRV